MAFLYGCIWLVVKEEGRIWGALFGHCHTYTLLYLILFIINYIASSRLFQLHLYIMYIYVHMTTIHIILILKYIYTTDVLNRSTKKTSKISIKLL